MSIASPPQPFGAVPSQRQLEWHSLEFYAFVHFGPNTFTSKEWGDGKEDPNIFNPTEFNTDQWCKVFSEAGMKGVIITAKHHDGFCLWPSKFSNHTVANSSWRNGKGDVLADLSKSCAKYGLKFGVYVSPWDRNHPLYGTDEYNSVFVNTLTEVLTSYGDVFEVWFDGANGEGPNGRKQVYDFPRFNQTVRNLQPKAVIFSDAGPDIRWVGNEAGYSDPTCFSTINRDRYVPGTPHYRELTQGTENGSHWVPAECDVSIRKGWFWRESENDTVKSGKTLLDLYLRSVGQNASFLLNVPPDTRGLIHEKDQAALMAFKRFRDQLFEDCVSIGASAEATNFRNNSSQFSPVHLFDQNANTYWATDDDTRVASVTIQLKRSSSVSTALIQEHIALGQRVTRFDIDAWMDGEWKTVFRGTTIGYKRIATFPAVQTDRLRFTVLRSNASPVINSLSFFSPSKIN